jgi:hypothetical protein
MPCLHFCCAGLFDNVKGPIPTSSGLFKGYYFVLTHVIKTPTVLAEEMRQLQDSSIESSTEPSADEGNVGLYLSHTHTRTHTYL